jgi:hypothetical protein
MVANDNAPNLTPRDALWLIASKLAPTKRRGYSGIVTGSVKSVYQIHGYMDEAPTPKISHADKAT